MSADFQTISKGTDLPVNRDYAKLRKLGISYIEKLGSDLWTDYNTHDPGITFLEMLCYAITDLGYRTNFDIKDILSLEPGLKYFHTAAEILTMNPVTINDYRKLVIDVEGVRNAWLIPTEQGGFYLNEHDEILTWEQDPDFPEIFVKGLYDILIEFEEDDEFGDLNEDNFDSILDVGGDDEEIEFIFPKWLSLTDLADGDKIRLWAEVGTTTGIVMDPDGITVDDDLNAYKIIASVQFQYPKAEPPIPHSFGCYKDNLDGGVVEPDPFIPETLTDSFTIEFYIRYDGPIEILKTDIFTELQKVVPENPIIFYQGRLQLTFQIVAHVRCALMDHRNLCEDFLSIRSLKTEEIALCVDIEIDRMADVNFIQAQIYEIIGEFISPTVHFYTLAEMFEKTQANGQKYTSDKIFNGPRLQHGFILDSELDAAILRTEIHTSDIYNLIMDIPGVLAIRELQVANFIDGLALTTGEEWSLKLKGDGLHVPKLSQDRSKITFYKDVIPYKANPHKVAEYLAEQKAKNLRLRLEETELDIEVPTAESPGIGEYTSILNGFPETFGIGQEGVPSAADALRKAQAKQLKGYLLHIDQILANYMAQLTHVRDLLSMDPDGDIRTYFTQVIRDVKDGESLFAEYDGAESDPYSPVQEALDLIAETDEVRFERKNRFLNHLMARFAEDFSEYSLIMFALDRENAGELLVEDKLQFLNDYPEISGNRFRAYNYRPKLDCGPCDPFQLWETDENVSGYKKRVSRLLGIESYQRGNLTCHCFEVVKIDHVEREDRWVFFLRDCNDPEAGPNDYLLRSVEFESEETAKFMITYALGMVEKGNLVERPEDSSISCKCCDVVELENPATYDENDPHNPRFVLLNRCGDVIACSMEWADDDERAEKFEYTQNYILENCTLEGFHLIEHILMRPELPDDLTGDHFLPICLCPSEEEEDGTAQEDEAPFVDLFFEFQERGVKDNGRIRVLDQDKLLSIWVDQVDEFQDRMISQFGAPTKNQSPTFFAEEKDTNESLNLRNALVSGDGKETSLNQPELSAGEESESTGRILRVPTPKFFEEQKESTTPKDNSLAFKRLSANQVSQLRAIFDKVYNPNRRTLNRDALFLKVVEQEERNWNKRVAEATAQLNPPISQWGFRVLTQTGKAILTSADFETVHQARAAAKKIAEARKYVQNYRLYQPEKGKSWAFEVYGKSIQAGNTIVVDTEAVKDMRTQLQALRRASAAMEPSQTTIKTQLLGVIRVLEEQARQMQLSNWDNSQFEAAKIEGLKKGLHATQTERNAVSKAFGSNLKLAQKETEKFKASFERAFPWTPTQLAYEIYEEADDDGKSELRFRVRNASTGKILLSSSTKYPSAEAAEAEMRKALEAIASHGGLREETARNNDFYFNVVDQNGDIIARRIAYFRSTRDRSEARLTLENAVQAAMMMGRLVLKPYDESELPPTAYLDHLDDWKEMVREGKATAMPAEQLTDNRFTTRNLNKTQMSLVLPTGKSPILNPSLAGNPENEAQYQRLYRNTFALNNITLGRYEETVEKVEAEKEAYDSVSRINQQALDLTQQMLDWFAIEPSGEGEAVQVETIAPNSRSYSELLAVSIPYTSAEERNSDANRLLGIAPLVQAPITQPGYADAPTRGNTRNCLLEADPYSFRMSIILPAWAGRFKDIHFRQLVEKTLRLEAPAHVALKICWIDRYQMADFECKYLNWVLEKGKCDATPASISPALNGLIDELNKLQNVYPVATLHDCDDSPDDVAAVILNQTSLGTL